MKFRSIREGDSALNGRQGAWENLGSSGIGHKSRVTLTKSNKRGPSCCSMQTQKNPVSEPSVAFVCFSVGFYFTSDSIPSKIKKKNHSIHSNLWWSIYIAKTNMAKYVISMVYDSIQNDKYQIIIRVCNKRIQILFYI